MNFLEVQTVAEDGCGEFMPPGPTVQIIFLGRVGLCSTCTAPSLHVQVCQAPHLGLPGLSVSHSSTLQAELQSNVLTPKSLV